MKEKKPIDSKAAEIEFGIELETYIPYHSRIEVGGYHGIRTGPVYVSGGIDTSGCYLSAPSFQGNSWRADKDSSIKPPPGYKACEFVSPVLNGDAGLVALRQFIAFANKVGAKVNASCGCHVTVGIKSVIGTADPKAVADYVRKLARHAHEHQWGIYAQTGEARHMSTYAHPLAEQHDLVINQFRRERDTSKLALMSQDTGRGMVNLRKAFLGERGAIEFRAFAGTLNEKKIFHHIATCLGLMRKAAAVERVPSFKVDARICRINTAPLALKRLWHLLGWETSSKTVELAYGLFGMLYDNIRSYQSEAMKVAQSFEQTCPGAFRPIPRPRPVATEPQVTATA